MRWPWPAVGRSPTGEKNTDTNSAVAIPSGRFHFEKKIGCQVVKKFPAPYGIQRVYRIVFNDDLF